MTFLQVVNAILIQIFYVVMYAGNIIMNLFFVMFVYRIYKKASNFSSAYFKLLAIEYFVNLASYYELLLLWTWGSFELKTGAFLQFFFPLGQWYHYRFYAFCNLILVLNRFTGVYFWKQHKKIWNGAIFYLVIFLLFAYPFFLSGYSLQYFWACIDVYIFSKYSNFS